MLPELQIRGAIATICLRRPESANKLTPADLNEIDRHLETINHAANVMVLILRGDGRYFCSGYDISALSGNNSESGRFGEVVDKIENCRAVTVAAVHGGVYGGGTDVALACDFRLGCEKTEMFMPAARLGLHFYRSGLERYVSRLGIDNAKRLFLTAERLDSRAMFNVGFLTHLVEQPTIGDAVESLATTLSTMAPIALLGMKKHLNQIARGTLDLESIEEAVARSLGSTDLIEGGNAWREKRPAIFVGR